MFNGNALSIVLLFLLNQKSISTVTWYVNFSTSSIKCNTLSICYVDISNFNLYISNPISLFSLNIYILYIFHIHTENKYHTPIRLCAIHTQYSQLQITLPNSNHTVVFSTNRRQHLQCRWLGRSQSDQLPASDHRSGGIRQGDHPFARVSVYAVSVAFGFGIPNRREANGQGTDHCAEPFVSVVGLQSHREKLPCVGRSFEVRRAQFGVAIHTVI